MTIQRNDLSFLLYSQLCCILIISQQIFSVYHVIRSLLYSLILLYSQPLAVFSAFNCILSLQLCSQPLAVFHFQLYSQLLTVFSDEWSVILRNPSALTSTVYFFQHSFIHSSLTLVFVSFKGRSREIYHTKRMQRLTCVSWSRDNRFILSGSDEMNVRLWKARASEKMGILKERQRAALNYTEKLKEKFAHHPQIKRISKHRQVPKHVLNASREHKIIRESQKRKEANRRVHSKPGNVPYVSERDKHVIDEQE